MMDYSIKGIEILKAVSIKEKIIKIYYIKSFCSSKDTIKIRQAKNRKEILQYTQHPEYLQNSYNR